MKIIMTGAAGFVGRNLSSRMGASDHEVLRFDKKGGPGVTKCDWASAPVQAGFEGADVLVHLAAWPYERSSVRAPVRTIHDGLTTLARSCEIAALCGVKTLCFMSSVAAYGKGNGISPPWREVDPAYPEDAYGIAKLAGERLVVSMAKVYGFRALIIRTGNVYGPYQTMGDRRRNVIGIFMTALMRGEPMSVVGDGEQLRSYLYIDDLVDGVCKLVGSESASGVYNLGGHHPTSINELALFVARAGDCEPSLARVPPSPVEIRQAWLDSSKVKEEFGWAASTTLSHGLARTWAWARTGDVPAWCEDDLPIPRSVG